MRILMFGRGVIATIYGQVLQEAGHRVEFLVRPGRAAEYGDEVRTDVVDARRSPLGRRVRTSLATRLRETLGSADEFDLVVLSVGHHRLGEAAAYLAPRIGDATVLVLGNVWAEPLAAIAPLPTDQVVFGFPQAGGGFGPDGVLHGALFRSITLDASGHAGRRGQLVRAAFRQAGLGTREEEDMRGWLLLHFAMDAGMFSQALAAGGLARMVGDPRALRAAFLASRELIPVLGARGVDLRRHAGTALPWRLPGLTAGVLAAATVLVPIARVSLAAHTDPDAAEHRAVLDDALGTARQLGIPTPRLSRAAR
ncbi:ketopantoate reductase [Clavibacter lycopersici]|uniref:Ketopantoate reductase n=1 Tax=Clavibacter lycopersici TaxID=2301718 RepID=A0A399TFC5_9MICO|nr:2-dehydropantoate 2-reductase N-terminal domain-containing protein [Clavibacter lycopersici]RIJ52733.1 ketopantoate reductase [Clavibacter lycopersici]RIJ62371.1 ketopantoate reductase [Clavibacter lycopersici]